MVAVHGMPVTVVHVIHMIAVRHRDVTAAVTVGVLVGLVRTVFSRFALIKVPTMRPMQMTVVDVVGVVAVRDGDMPATRAMLMSVSRVLNVRSGHDLTSSNQSRHAAH
jgi:hypothetical protein